MSNPRILMEAQRFLIIGYKKTKKENFYCLFLDEEEVKDAIKSFYRSTGEKENGFEIWKKKEKFQELTQEEKSEFLEKIVPVMLKKPKIEDDINFDPIDCTAPLIENFCKVLNPLVKWATEQEIEVSHVLPILKCKDIFITFWLDDTIECDVMVKGDKFVIETSTEVLVTNDLEVVKKYFKK